MRFLYFSVVGMVFLCISACESIQEQPNIIFILTDDQGYGDIACHGNPWLQTPHIDELYNQSIRFTNFHVGTTCAPTRAGLLTGKACNKVGVWHTINGRSLLRAEEKTLADILKENGYNTSIFGKWHLGDNYPYRPEDRGFDEVLTHGGGGIGQTPDYWNNDYFDDTYFRNGKPEKMEGYCTDVFFEEAMKWINKQDEKPFFTYISTNAPHTPLHVEEHYAKPYKNFPEIKSADFYGMIANIDENIGKLISFLKETKRFRNTIIIFMTDNGTIEGASFSEGLNGNDLVKGYNAGMRGLKTSPYEGGHRVPFFILWEEGGLKNGKDIDELSSYTDFLPTIADLCGIKMTDKTDGLSLLPLLNNTTGWKSRTLVVDTQREEFLKKGKQFAVMTDQWRLVGEELYDIKKDPLQEHDIANEFPEIVKNLQNAYEEWWSDVSQNKDEYERIVIGKDLSRHALTVHDCHMTKGYPAWNQDMIRSGTSENGFWTITVEEEGAYEFHLQRWPEESGLALGEKAPEGENIPGGEPYEEGRSFTFKKAKLKINEKEFESDVDNNAASVSFKVHLDKGDYNIQSWLTDVSGVTIPAFYVYIK